LLHGVILAESKRKLAAGMEAIIAAASGGGKLGRRPYDALTQVKAVLAAST
jgi:hypothetical protein